MPNEQKKPVIVAVITHIDCPICGLTQTGFVNDPRGSSFDCSECGKPFHIPADAPIDFG